MDAFDDVLVAVVVSTLGIDNTPSDAWLPQLRARFAGLDVDAAIAAYRTMQREQRATPPE